MRCTRLAYPAFAAALAISASARADEAGAPPAAPPAPAAVVAAPAAAALAPLRLSEIRGLAAEPGIEPEDVGLLVPRVVLAIPARVLSLAFFPIHHALRVLEKHHLIEHVEDLLYNDARTAAILPVLTLSTFLGAQIGIKAFHQDLGGHGEFVGVKASWGVDEEQLYELWFHAAKLGGTPLWVEARTIYEDHPALRFYGFAGDADAVPENVGLGLDPGAVSVETFYAQRRFRQLLAFGATAGDRTLSATAGVRSRLKVHEFAPARGLARGDRQLAAVYDTAKVPGYEAGATLVEVEALGILDARDPTPHSGHAFHAELFAGGAVPGGEFHYGHFGAEATGYVDLYHGDRLLVLRLVLEGVEGDPAKVPFVELPSLGGPHRLRGFPLHRYRDEKLLLGTVEYQCPIHEYVAGSLYMDVGEVAPDYEQLFRNPGFRVGGGAGLVLRSKSKVYFTLDVAGGEGVQVYATTDPLRAFADRDDDL
ncbi:MAG: BamA/TamA family outer membrane protein [Polyangiaceae bacterium]|nr:BamA/TamA family outer membrane protein [Polyangiaceae bacterium]